MSGALKNEFQDKGFLWGTPYSISFDDQQKLIDYTLKHGWVVPSEMNVLPPFWVGMSLTDVPQEEKAHIPEEHRGRWMYLVRNRVELGWFWRDIEIAPIVQRALEPMKPYFSAFTRVTIFLQVPNQALPPHRDLLPGNEYRDMESSHLTFSGDKKLRYEGDPWFAEFDRFESNEFHRDQKFFNLKIPLSQNPNSPGKPYVIWQGKKYHYDSQGRFFFLNEVEIEHGADPVPFYRGVIFVDGTLNLKALENFPISTVEVSLSEYDLSKTQSAQK